MRLKKMPELCLSSVIYLIFGLNTKKWFPKVLSVFWGNWHKCATAVCRFTFLWEITICGWKIILKTNWGFLFFMNLNSFKFLKNRFLSDTEMVWVRETTAINE